MRDWTEEYVLTFYPFMLDVRIRNIKGFLCGWGAYELQEISYDTSIYHQGFSSSTLRCADVKIQKPVDCSLYFKMQLENFEEKQACGKSHLHFAWVIT